MILQTIEVTLKPPRNLSICDIRQFIVDNLNMYGEPLRWFIASSNASKNSDIDSVLVVEAVVIVNNNIKITQ